MPKRCKIIIKNFEIIAKLNSSLTAKKIWDSLPINSKTQTWGHEIYFNTLINVELDKNAKKIIELGEIVFWPQGKVIAIGFGKTPLSIDNEIRLAAKCNVWAHTSFDLKKLINVGSGAEIRVEKVV